MHFRLWVKSQRDARKTGVLTGIQRVTGLGYQTLLRCQNGKPCGGRVAKLISDATGGEVSIEHLVCPPELPADEGVAA